MTKNSWIGKFDLTQMICYVYFRQICMSALEPIEASFASSVVLPTPGPPATTL
jgi:hypothetical protein